MLAYQIGYLSNVIPIPGGIGVLDGSMVGMLVLYGVAATPAAAATIVYHAIALWIPAMWGTLAFLILRRTRHEPLTPRPRSPHVAGSALTGGGRTVQLSRAPPLAERHDRAADRGDPRRRSVACACNCGCPKRLPERSLDLADPVQQFAYEHGAGVVESEVTAEPFRSRDPRGVARVKGVVPGAAAGCGSMSPNSR